MKIFNQMINKLVKYIMINIQIIIILIKIYYNIHGYMIIKYKYKYYKKYLYQDIDNMIFKKTYIRYS